MRHSFYFSQGWRDTYAWKESLKAVLIQQRGVLEGSIDPMAIFFEHYGEVRTQPPDGNFVVDAQPESLRIRQDDLLQRGLLLRIEDLIFVTLIVVVFAFVAVATTHLLASILALYASLLTLSVFLKKAHARRREKRSMLVYV